MTVYRHVTDSNGDRWPPRVFLVDPHDTDMAVLQAASRLICESTRPLAADMNAHTAMRLQDVGECLHCQVCLQSLASPYCCLTADQQCRTLHVFCTCLLAKNLPEGRCSHQSQQSLQSLQQIDIDRSCLSPSSLHLDIASSTRLSQYRRATSTYCDPRVSLSTPCRSPVQNFGPSRRRKSSRPNQRPNASHATKHQKITSLRVDPVQMCTAIIVSRNASI